MKTLLETPTLHSMTESLIQQIRASHYKLAYRDFGGEVLTGVCIENRDLTGSTFVAAQLGQAAFRGDVNSCSFQRAYLRYANFKGCNIQDVNFADAVLSHATFEGAKLTRVDFRGAYFNNTDFRGAILEDCVGLPDFDGDQIFNHYTIIQ